MTHLHRVNGSLFLEQVPLLELAREYGTPLYVYSQTALTDAYHAYEQALADLPYLICYAVKANSNLAILQHFARLGAGFDIVSGGELARVQAAGGHASKIVFSGVGKTEGEMRSALQAGIRCFNVESEGELTRLNRVAKEMGKTAPVSLRVNPDVDPKTHPYISTGLKQNKFGIPIHQAQSLYMQAAALSNIKVAGVDCHIGSQLLDLSPIADALDRILELVDALALSGIELSHIDIGGGLGIRYRDESPPDMAAYRTMLKSRLQARSQRLIVEPGRSLVGDAGLLLTRIEYVKYVDNKNFVVVDAAMNDLMRPALYDAFHDIVPVRDAGDPSILCDVVGPVCESGDFIGLARNLPAREGELLAILSAGAYGMSMSSNYNSRPRAAELLLNKNEIYLVRERETTEQLMAGERLVS
jgi:diaminopimelate decarboxylase